MRAAIHPAIGIGRVGNSRDSFFFGPEIPGTLPHAKQGFRDAHGAVARQAARFRVFGLDSDGQVVRELTASDAEITWRVDVANSKAAWYEFAAPFVPTGSRRGATAGLRSWGVCPVCRAAGRRLPAAIRPAREKSKS